MRNTILATLVAMCGCSGGTAPVQTGDAPLLAPPKAGEGIQVEMGPFQVPQGTEVQVCRTFKLPNDEPMAVNRFLESHTIGSHHVILFRRIGNVPVDDQVFPCWGLINFDEWEFVTDSQQKSNSEITLPPGIGLIFQPHHQVMIQAHYVNATTVKTPQDGHSFINLYTMPIEKVTSRAAGKFTVNARVLIPPHTDNITFTRDCSFSNPASIFAMTGHFHARGTEFRVDALDAQNNPSAMIYDGHDWNNEPLLNFPPMAFTGNSSGGPPGIRFSCTYDNDSDNTIVWGGHADTQEHCNLFFWYFDPTIPADRDPSLECLNGSGGW